MNHALKELYRYIYKHKYSIYYCKESNKEFEFRLCPPKCLDSFFVRLIGSFALPPPIVFVLLSSNPKYSRVFYDYCGFGGSRKSPITNLIVRKEKK